MTEQEINNIWDDFTENFAFSDKQLPYVYFFCKKFKIDPDIFQTNFFC